MSILTSIFIAGDGDLQHVEDTIIPPRHLPSLDFTGITVLDLAILYSIVTNQNYDVSLIDAFEPVLENENGPWIYRFPPTFVDALAMIETHHLCSIARMWLTHEEMKGAKETCIINLIGDIQEFAQQAKQTAKGLLLWMNL